MGRIKSIIKNNRILYILLSKLYYWDWNLRKLFKFKFIDKQYLNKEKIKYSYQEYKYGTSVLIRHPLIIETQIPTEMKKFVNTSIYFPPSFYNVIPNTYLVGPNAICIDQNNNIHILKDQYSLVHIGWEHEELKIHR